MGPVVCPGIGSSQDAGLPRLKAGVFQANCEELIGGGHLDYKDKVQCLSSR